MTDNPWGVFTEDDLQLFDRVARSLRKRAHGLLDFDDLYQTAALWALENQRKYREASEVGESHAFKLLHSRLVDVIRRERAQRDGYEPEDQYRYSPKVLKRLLPLAFDPTWMEQSQQYESDPKGMGGQPSDPANIWVMVADVKAAFPKMADRDRVLLYRTLCGPGSYRDVTHEIARDAGVAPKRVQDEVKNALGRLARQMRKERR